LAYLSAVLEVKPRLQKLADILPGKESGWPSAYKPVGRRQTTHHTLSAVAIDLKKFSS